MSDASDATLEKIKAREVAAVFRSRAALDAAVDALLLAGFDRGDIDLMASADAVREKLGTIYIAAEELADVPQAPRQAFVKRDEVASTLAGVASILTFVGATAAAFPVVASGGALALAAAAAVAGGAAGGGIGALLTSRILRREDAKEIETQLAAGGLVLWVRVRSPEREEMAQRIVKEHRGEAVRVHEIEIEKRWDDLPLSKIRPDPWLGDERLAQP
jgi:hypothetical protein